MKDGTLSRRSFLKLTVPDGVTDFTQCGANATDLVADTEVEIRFRLLELPKRGGRIDLEFQMVPFD